MAPSDTELIDRTLTQVFLEEALYPFLYRPVDELTEYLDTNLTLFTLIGVFGATSIYARQATSDLIESGTFGEIVVVTGFSLVILLSLVTMIDLVRRIYSNGGFISFANIGLISFAAFYIPLISVVSILVVQFPSIWLPYLFTLAYLGGIAAPIVVWKPALVVSNFLDDYFGTGQLFRGVIASSVLVLWFQVTRRVNPFLSSYSGSQLELTVEYAVVVFLAFSLGFTGLVGLFFILTVIISFLVYLLKSLIQNAQSAIQ